MLRASVVFFIVLTFTAHAQNGGITLRLKNVPLIVAMDSIQQHSGYRFSYNLALAPQLQQTRVSIHATGEPIEKVLNLLFSSKGIKYQVVDNNILLSKSDPPKPLLTACKPAVSLFWNLI